MVTISSNLVTKISILDKIICYHPCGLEPWRISVKRFYLTSCPIPVAYSVNDKLQAAIAANFAQVKVRKVGCEVDLVKSYFSLEVSFVASTSL